MADHRLDSPELHVSEYFEKSDCSRMVFTSSRQDEKLQKSEQKFILSFNLVSCVPMGSAKIFILVKLMIIYQLLFFVTTLPLIAKLPSHLIDIMCIITYNDNPRLCCNKRLMLEVSALITDFVLSGSYW